MKKRHLWIIGLLFLPVLAGCYRYGPVHSEKTHREFYEDRAVCEEQARKWAKGRHDDISVIDEISHTRRCLKNKGWEYRFKKR